MNIQHFKFLLGLVLLVGGLVNSSVSMATQELEKLFSRRQVSYPTRFEETSISQNIPSSTDELDENCFPFSFFRGRSAKIAPLPSEKDNHVPQPISPLKNTCSEQNSMNSSYLFPYREPSSTILQREDSNNLNKAQLNFTNEFNRLETYSAGRISQPEMLMYSHKKAQFFIAHPSFYKGEGIAIKSLSKEAGKRCLTCESQIIGTYIFGGVK